MIFILILLTGLVSAFDLENETDLNQSALNQSALNQSALNQSALNQSALNQSALNQSALNQSALNQSAQEWYEAIPESETDQNMTDQETVSLWPAYKNPFKPGSDLSKFGKQQIRNYQ